MDSEKKMIFRMGIFHCLKFCPNQIVKHADRAKYGCLYSVADFASLIK